MQDVASLPCRQESDRTDGAKPCSSVGDIVARQGELAAGHVTSSGERPALLYDTICLCDTCPQNHGVSARCGPSNPDGWCKELLPVVDSASKQGGTIHIHTPGTLSHVLVA